MPVEQPEIVTYKEWKNGPWHKLGPDYGPEKGFNYDCVNMQVYDNGSLGPRPCLKSIGIESDLDYGLHQVSNQYFLGMYVYQAVDYNMGPFGREADDKLRVGILEQNAGNKFAFWDETSGALGNLGTISLANFREIPKPNRYSDVAFDHATDGSAKLISSVPMNRLGADKLTLGGDGYLHNMDDSSADGYQAITAGTAGQANEYPSEWDPTVLFSWRDRYWSWGDYRVSGTKNLNRIHYSDVGTTLNTSIGTWQANSFIDVGADSELPIIGVWPVFDSILICMADNRWYRYTFTDNPDFGEIRFIGTKIIPDHFVTAATTGSAIIYTTRQSGLVVATKDAIDDQSFDYIGVPPDGDDNQPVFFMRGLTSHAYNAICLPYKVTSVSASAPNNVYKGDRSLELVNGVWTHHLYFGTGDDSVLNPAFVDCMSLGNDHFGFYALDDWNTGTGDSTIINILYTRPVCLNRPSNSADTFSSNSEVASHTNDTDDRFEGTIWLSTYRPPEKTSGAVEKVIIDFDYWNSSGFTTPAFTVKADCIHEGDEINTITLGSLDESELVDTSGTSYIPKRGRVVLRPSRMPLSSQINVSITGIKSVAFKEVSVVYAIQPQTPLTNVNT
tara:strand:- start:8166 stop:10010 length:1845 start_codon:yes stop_codon:yes gene_type:complete